MDYVDHTRNGFEWVAEWQSLGLDPSRHFALLVYGTDCRVALSDYHDSAASAFAAAQAATIVGRARPRIVANVRASDAYSKELGGAPASEATRATWLEEWDALQMTTTYRQWRDPGS